jgi:glyoxalase family protein
MADSAGTIARPAPSAGLHHVTALCRDAQTNLDFYARVLGLRLVKRTVNFDDPGAYHLYYGDGLGRPGTILTFFPYPHSREGHAGAGQAVAVALAVPPGSLDWWEARLAAHGVVHARTVRFGGAERFITLYDPDGLAVELVAAAGGPDAVAWAVDAAAAGWDCPVPAEYAVRGLHGATLLEADAKGTAGFLTEVLGFDEVGREGERVRYATGDGGSAALIDVLDMPTAGHARTASGSIHHLAWRAVDDAQQREWLMWLRSRSAHVSEVRDRCYFHSIYFHEPGGVLFEFATDGPGFGIDEAPAELGSRLCLPPWYEELRPKIEAALPPLV